MKPGSHLQRVMPHCSIDPKIVILNYLLQCGYKETTKDKFISPDGFVYNIKERTEHNEPKIEMLLFETSEPTQQHVQISERIIIEIAGNNGKIIFK